MKAWHFSSLHIALADFGRRTEESVQKLVQALASPSSCTPPSLEVSAHLGCHGEQLNVAKVLAPIASDKSIPCMITPFLPVLPLSGACLSLREEN